jgi:hypothetical protein
VEGRVVLRQPLMSRSGSIVMKTGRTSRAAGPRAPSTG